MIVKCLVEEKLNEIQKWLDSQTGYNHQTRESWPHIRMLMKMVNELVDRVNELERLK